ncbi:uncharacterized protein [Dysidea avara]|uniref:uncharacterized protein n=1 Tax=Dysidea avara TaxID=196820 RepID=UPI00333434D5
MVTVPKWFWSQYKQSANVFTIGEVFNGDVDYVAGYQGSLDALLNYPMYYKLQTAFQKQQSMRAIHDGVTSERSKFPDVSILGNFIDNHDNPRFLNGNSQYTLLYNALAYIIFAEGIPIIYYGTEQGFNGGNDPDNRASLWPNYNTNHVVYKFISNCTHFRQQMGSSMYGRDQVERYVDDQFFSFSRGELGLMAY